MPARGIIGRKPTTTGLTSYSDVFGPDTQFTQQSVGTWPTVGSSSGTAKFVVFNYPTQGFLFDSYKKLSDGLYYPERIYDAIPSTTGNNGFWSGTSLSGADIAASKNFVCLQTYLTSTTTGTAVLMWKRVSNYNAQYKYLGTPLDNGTSAYRIRGGLAFNDTETLLATYWDRGGTNSNQIFRVYSVNKENETFTEISVPDIISTTTRAYSLSTMPEWNRQGTSVFVAFDTSPYHVIYNVSGTSFSKLASLPSYPITNSSSPVSADWSPDGNTLAVFTRGAGGVNYGTLLIYNRNGDTFSLATTMTVEMGYPASSRGKFVSWHPSGTLLAVGAASGLISSLSGFGISPLRVYSRSGDTFTPISVPDPVGLNPSENFLTRSINFTPDGTELFISVADPSINNIGPGIEIYKVNGTTITRNSEWGFATTQRYYYSSSTRAASQLGTTYGSETKNMTQHQALIMIRQ